MPRLEYFLVCESTSIDVETNRISLFNVIEELHLAPQGAPARQPAIPVSQCVAVACWNQEPDDEEQDYQETVRICPPGQGQNRDFHVNFSMQGQGRRHRVTLRLQGIPQLEPGELRFELLLNGDYVASHTIDIHQPPGEPVAPQ